MKGWITDTDTEILNLIELNRPKCVHMTVVGSLSFSCAATELGRGRLTVKHKLNFPLETSSNTLSGYTL